MDQKQLAAHLDLANHHSNATPEQIKSLCQKVKRFGFNSAFLNPCYVKLARETIAEKGKVGTVIAFPLGQDKTDVKILSAIEATRSGADELDVSLNIGWFKAGKRKEVLNEAQKIVEAAKNIKKGVIVKFIIETGLLTDKEIKVIGQLVLKSGADFVKTCSGMGPRGASLKDVELIKQAIGDKIRIKVAGGIHTRAQALAFIKQGADRIGTSKAVEIIKGGKG